MDECQHVTDTYLVDMGDYTRYVTQCVKCGVVISYIDFPMSDEPKSDWDD
jgi:hypothetical protein